MTNRNKNINDFLTFIATSQADALLCDRINKKVTVYRSGNLLLTENNIDVPLWNNIVHLMDRSFHRYQWCCFKDSCIITDDGSEIEVNFMGEKLKRPLKRP